MVAVLWGLVGQGDSRAHPVPCSSPGPIAFSCKCFDAPQLCRSPVAISGSGCFVVCPKMRASSWPRGPLDRSGGGRSPSPASPSAPPAACRTLATARGRGTGWVGYKQVLRFPTGLISKGKGGWDFTKEELHARVLLLSDEQSLPSSP